MQRAKINSLHTTSVVSSRDAAAIGAIISNFAWSQQGGIQQNYKTGKK